uniref:DEAH-box helicase 32 (putative) n=1 Tax=Oncorhynchus kisutch TaxID=8019 RepID=A0A8C7NBL6_ONCKI
MSEQDKHLMEKEICSDSETADCVEEAFVFGEDLELNRFDGLPFSSRYYKLLQERQSLPVWKAREEFLDILVNNRLVIVSGTTKTGKSTQVSVELIREYSDLKYDFQRISKIIIKNNIISPLIPNTVSSTYIIIYCFCCRCLSWYRGDRLEVVCARAILQREGTRLGADLGELVPVVLCPGQGRPTSLLGEGMGSRGTVTTRCRLVFLSTSQGEDMFWAVDSVNFVIDVGLEKRYVYHPRIRANSEVLRSISRYQADIRKQLTGPTGKCFCLYPEERVLPVETSPQILDTNLTFTILFLKRMEIAGLRHCDFITRPDPEGLMQSLEELDYLAALDDDGNLSEIGIIISELPLDAQMAKALLASCEFDCVNEVVTISAMLSAPSCFLEPPVGRTQEVQQCHRKFRHPEGDHFTLINIYNAFKYSQRETYFSVEKWCQDYHLNHRALQTADAIRSELTDILKRIELPISETSFGTKINTLNIKRALLAGFFMQIARDVDGSGNYFMLTNRHMAQVHPASSYGAKAHQLGFPEWVLFHEYTLSGNHGIRTVSEISPAVFIQTAPQYFYSNLPPSESKDLLQHILDQDGSGRKDKQQTLTINSKADKDCSTVAQSYDRCVLQ